LHKKFLGIITNEYLIYIGTLVVLPLVVTLFNHYEAMDWIMLTLSVLSVGYILFIAFKLEKAARLKLLTALILIIFSTLFWSFYEQNSGSLNLFAMRNVDMQIGNTKLAALSVNNFLPPGWVIILSFVFAWLWPWLSKRKREPSTPLKFALSFIFLGLGFFTFYLACRSNLNTGLIPLIAFVAGYFFIICGEMCLSPVGLSMVTKLSPINIVGMMMGIWFFASAIGEFSAGKIGSMMSVPEAVVNTGNPVLSLPYYADILYKIALFSIGAGALLICLVPLLRKWMSDIK
jgi:POT family proton-dependent oligopeptide transporter